MTRSFSAVSLGLLGACALAMACGGANKPGLGIDFDGGDGTGTGSGSGGSGTGSGGSGSGSGGNTGSGGSGSGTGGMTGRGGAGMGIGGAGTGGAGVGTGGAGAGTGGAGMGAGGALAARDAAAGGGADALPPQVIARMCQAGNACSLGPSCSIPPPLGTCFEGRQLGQQQCVCNNGLYFCACVPSDAGLPMFPPRPDAGIPASCPTVNPTGMMCTGNLGCIYRADGGAIIGTCDCRNGMYTNCEARGGSVDCPAGAASNGMACPLDGQRCTYRTEAGQTQSCRCQGNNNMLTWRCGG